MKGRVICIGCAAAFTLCTLAPFYTMTVSADNVNSRYTINADAFADYYDTIDGTYLGSDGNFHDITFSLISGINQYSGDLYYPNEVSYNIDNFTCVTYRSDLQISSLVYNDWQVPKVVLYPHIHISHCSYIGFGFVGYMYPYASSFQSQVYESVKNYNSIVYKIPAINYSEEVYLGSNTRYMGFPSALRLQNDNRPSCWSGLYHSAGYQVDTDFLIDSITISCIQNQGNDFLYFSFFLPVVSENAVLEEPDSYVPSIGSYEGEMSGSLVTDNSGGYNANFNFQIDLPDYNNQFNNIQSAINPPYESSNVDDMQAAIQTGVSEEEEVMRQASTVLTSLPDTLDFDESITSGAVGNPFATFFNENIVGIMVFWVGTIAFISYILFGKWV